MATKKGKRRISRDIARQKIWDYLRRNRKEVFVDDIVMITGVELDRVRRYLSVLKRAGYVKEVFKAPHFRMKSFSLIKCTGVVAPVANYNEGVLIDRNTDERISVKKEPVYVRIRREILRLCEEGKEVRISNLLGSGGRTTIKRELTKLSRLGVLSLQKRAWGGYIYGVDIPRLKRLMKG